MLVASDERADGAALRGGGHVADDDELARSSIAFDLEPGLRAPGAIGRVGELGDDALQAEPAGVLQNEVAALGEVLAVLENAFACTSASRAQRGLAVEQRGGAQVLAVQMQQVEEVVAEAVAAALAQVRLQGAEVRHAVVGLDHHLAVEECGDDRQRVQRLGHIGELGRPIKPAAGQQLDAAVIDAAPAAGSRRI